MPALRYADDVRFFLVTVYRVRALRLISLLIILLMISAFAAAFAFRHCHYLFLFRRHARLIFRRCRCFAYFLFLRITPFSMISSPYTRFLLRRCHYFRICCLLHFHAAAFDAFDFHFLFIFFSLRFSSFSSIMTRRFSSSPLPLFCCYTRYAAYDTLLLRVFLR